MFLLTYSKQSTMFLNGNIHMAQNHLYTELFNSKDGVALRCILVLHYSYPLASSLQVLTKKTEQQTLLQHTVLIIWVGIFLSSRKLSRIQRPKKILEIIRLRCLGLQSSSFSLLSSMILNSGIVLSCNYTRTLEYTF